MHEAALETVRECDDDDDHDAHDHDAHEAMPIEADKCVCVLGPHEHRGAGCIRRVLASETGRSREC